MPDSISNDKLIVAINKSTDSNKLSEKELKVLTNNTLHAILKDKRIEAGSSDTKKQLIDKLMDR